MASKYLRPVSTKATPEECMRLLLGLLVQLLGLLFQLVKAALCVNIYSIFGDVSLSGCQRLECRRVMVRDSDAIPRLAYHVEALLKLLGCLSEVSMSVPRHPCPSCCLLG